MQEIKNDISGTSTLVSRLTKSERAHISKVLSLSKGHSLHRMLFEIMCRKENKNEDEIKKNYLSKTKQKNYTQVKSQLLEIVLSALTDLNKNPLDEYNLYRKLEQAKILSQKQMFAQGLKICQSVLKPAKTLDFFALQLKCYEQIIEIAIRTKSLKDIEFSLHGMNELVKNQSLYNNLLSLTHKANVTFFTKSGKEDFSSSFEEIIKELKDPNHESLRIQSYYYHLRGFILLVYNCDYEAALVYFQKNMELITQDKDYLKSHNTAYQTALHNIAMCYDQLNDEENYFKLFAAHEKLMAGNPETAEDTAYNIVLKQTFFHRRNQHKQVLVLMEEKESELKQLDHLIPSGIKLVCCINTYMSCIYCNEWKKALKWNNMVINEHFEQILDLDMFNKLANLIIHHELGNTDLIESILPNVQRYLSSYGYYNGIFKDIYTFFKEISKDYEGTQELKLLNELKQKLEDVKDQPTFNLQEAIQFVIDWIDDRMERLK